jgi:ankyrin repeat protein
VVQPALMTLARTLLTTGLLLALGAGCRAPADRAPEGPVGNSEASARDPYGLIVGGQMGGRNPFGVTCFTPWGYAASVRDVIGHGDVMDSDLARQLNEAQAYNRAMVERTDYPYRDLCRPRTEDDTGGGQEMNQKTDRPVREVTGPVRSLHEAARRGTEAELRQFLARSPVNAPDGTGMTALGWAVARNNGPAIDALLAAGADPLAAGDWGEPALYWAAVHGRRAVFERLLDRVPADQSPRVKGWRRNYLMAAAQGGDLTIIRRMLADPHETIQATHLDAEMPIPVLTLFLKDQQGEFADDLLHDALDSSSDGAQLDAVRLALANGADPNKVRHGETPLGQVASGNRRRSPEAVRLLLAAGADPDALTRRSRPVWIAINSALLSGARYAEGQARALRIVDLLVAAGADLNLANEQDKPMVWTLFFPFHHSPDDMDASFVTLETLQGLKRRGVDFNAPWRGRTLLAAVEAKGQAEAEYAVWLRAVGARR